MEEIREMIEKLGPEYSLWIHGIDKGELGNRESIARMIMETGLNIPGNYSSILSTAVAAGRVGYDAIQEDIENYHIDNGETCNVVVAAPIFIESSTGEKIYLGSPDRNMQNKAQTREPQIVLDEICGKLGKIPSEFIYGYYDEISGQITPNEGHFSKLPIAERDQLFDKLTEALNKTIAAKDINEKMLSGNKSALEAQIDWVTGRGLPVRKIVEVALRNFDQHYAMIDVSNDLKRETINNGIKVSATIEQEEDLGRRFAEYEKSVPSRIFATRRALEKSKQEMMDVLDGFLLDDIDNVSNVNVHQIERVVAIQKRLPDEFKADRLLEERLGQKLEERMKFSGRRIITPQEIEERKELSSSFDATVAAFVFEGGRDVVSRFRPLIQKMSRAGIPVNLGRTVLGAGDKIVERMAEIERTEGRGSKAWKLMLEPVLHMYDISKDLGGEKWNPQEHKAFEDKLVRLGLIEIAKEDRQVETETKVERKDGRSDRADSQTRVQLRQGLIREAEVQYVNTGMTPIGFKLDNEGNVVEETQIERMRRETQMQQNLARERAKYEQRNQERQQIQIGINGQPISNEAKIQQQARQQIQQQQREQRRRQQGMEIE